MLAEELTGCQVPTFQTVPPHESSSGGEAAELMDLAGVHLDPWQRLILDGGMGERADGSWSAFEVAMILARQNGKNVVFEARELAGLFLLNERMVVHTAHQYKTSQESFRHTVETVTNCDWMRRKVKRIVRTNGEETIELLSGCRLRFLARSLASGRGFSGNVVVLDEAYELGDNEMSALLPTLSAQPNPQVWYGSSAGMSSSVQLARVWRRIRRAARSGAPDRSLAGYEWAANMCSIFCLPDCGEHDRIDDPVVWAKTNPALGLEHANGTRLTAEFIENELATFGPEAFRRERLSVGEYPSDAEELWEVIDEDRWRSLEDQGSRATGQVCFAVAVMPHRRSSAICLAGLRADGRIHIEVAEAGPDTDWVAAKCAEYWARHRPLPFVVDPGSHAGSLIDSIELAGVEVARPFTTRDAANACGQFYDLCQQDRLRHGPQGELSAAVAGAKTRMLADAWAWDQKSTSANIAPLIGCSLAAWGLQKYGRPRLAPYDIGRSVA